ncbi:MAG: hypothetical protein COA96_09385 [SAR86 cluster bacterium]|uniref:Tetratricopeptide repeat protein n=1 Tax=SAR86 cluster bacterium TaxID=2030880 RepID=A0A2A5AZ94_9GAMM|nr:MAG: hypothetical protein COA96_09385 [SAR86 cluster bacterium]
MAASLANIKPKSELGFVMCYALALTLLVAVVLTIYWPGLTGPFILDDYSNLSPMGDNGGINNIPNFLSFVFGNDSGPTGRPISMLSFLIDGQSWPPNIASFKYTNLLIHILNGVVLCWLAITLFQILGLSPHRSACFALLLTAIWLLHPLNSTTTLYVVQRMTQLMTLFALAALICFMKGRVLISSEPIRGLIVLSVALFPFGLLSVLSKENGALLLLVIAVIELSVFQLSEKTRLYKYWYRLGVLVPIAIMGLFLLLTLSDSIAGFDTRHFTLGERLLSEARILTTYISRIFLPNVVGAGLFHDDFQVSTSLFSPLSTLFSVVFLTGLLGAGFFLRKQQPMFFFGVAWFFSMHLLESTYLPLELYFEHRNYLSMIGPLISATWYLQKFLQSDFSRHSKNLVISITAFLLIAMSWLSWQQALLWSNTGQLLAYWAYEEPRSSRAQISYADFLMENGAHEEGMDRLLIAYENNPNEITVMLHMWNRSCDYGPNIPFSLRDIAAREDLEYFHNDINFHLIELIQNLIANKCEYPERQVLMSLFDRIDNMPLTDRRRAGFHFLHSDLFVYYRELNSALIQLGNAFSISNAPQIPIRQAILSASAGNYEDALVFLQRARLANAQQSSLLPSLDSEIDRMEEDLKQRLDTQR